MGAEALTTPLASLQGVGPARAAGLEKRGLRTAGDLLFFLPNRYEDRRRVTSIRDAPWTGRAVVVARCTSVEVKQTRRRTKLLEASFADGTGTLDAVWFNFYPSLRQKLERPPRLFVLSGEIKRGFRGRRQMAHPELEEQPEEAETVADPLSFGRIVPVYGEVEGFAQKSLRRLTSKVIELYGAKAPDALPQWLRERHGLLELPLAIAAVHFPPQEESLEGLDGRAGEGHRRLIFEELFFIQLGLALRKRGVKIEPGIAFDVSPRILERALARLPFQLTGAQRRSVDEILRDMSRPEPMHRLLQGDVGSGKTAVALIAMLVAVANRKQAAIMAPTEILAEQHARSIGRMLAGTGIEPPLLTASVKGDARARTLAGLRDGTIPIVVGTHALLTEGVEFKDLALVVVDEQHRFGVMQRMQLIQKGRRPDVLVMTATPIPRTLAMTLYGDLDVSVIDELPPGRTPVTTRVWNANKREAVYELVAKELRAGRQAYVVLPLIEESESEELANIRDATKVFEELSTGALQDFSLALVHGRLPFRERDKIMEDFRAGRVQALVATTVIEVGVDVPNATVMVVEHAERFGLSQLHQLRGRVGRGAAKSWCHLVAEFARGEKARERLGAMARTQNGFEISEVDLGIRGPGEFLGTKQSGLPDLTVASLTRDQRVLELARREAFALVQEDPELVQEQNRPLADAVRTRWAGRISVGRVG